VAFFGLRRKKKIVAQRIKYFLWNIFGIDFLGF